MLNNFFETYDAQTGKRLFTPQINEEPILGHKNLSTSAIYYSPKKSLAHTYSPSRVRSSIREIPEEEEYHY